MYSIVSHCLYIRHSKESPKDELKRENKNKRKEKSLKAFLIKIYISAIYLKQNTVPLSAMPHLYPRG